jgi:hypothetical protein
MKIKVVEDVLSYPHCLSAVRSVESMVMSHKESLAFGNWNMIRHNEVEILEDIKSDEDRSRAYSLIHVRLLVPSKPQFDRPIALSFSNRGGLMTPRVADISML